MTHAAHTVIDSPIGPLTLTTTGDALSGLWLGPTTQPPGRTGAPLLTEAATQLAAYFAGERTCFDLPLTFGDGTPFQQQVWAALCDIPYGETISYGQLATRIGQPGAARAVGLANNRNPIAIIVPCHRVIGAGGDLVGYGGGLDRKRYLLALEQRVSGAALF
jgi:methylated-DNA-[protein]-cysteine S-methyltransferase